MVISKGFVKALLCRVPYRFVMALLGIEMAKQGLAAQGHRIVMKGPGSELQSMGTV